MAEIKINLYTSVTVNTKKLGRLTFSTLNFDATPKTNKPVSSLATDREAFLHILHRLMKEPKKALHDLASLPDRTLKNIGKELLTKSLMIDRYERLKRGRGNFFSKFKRLLEERTDSKKNFFKKVVGMVGAGACKPVLGREKNLMDAVTTMLSPPWQSFLDAENKKLEIIKTVEERLAESFGITSLDSSTSAVSKEGYDYYGGELRR